MGDQHRTDTARAQRQDHDDAANDRSAQREQDDAQFDPAHGKTQLAYHAKDKKWDNPAVPVHSVEAKGDADTLRSRYAAARDAKHADEVLAIVRDMDTARRREVQDDLETLAAFMSPRDILTVAGLAEASVDATVVAALQASPAIKREQLRAFFADISPYLLNQAFKNDQLVSAVRSKFPGSPSEILPQLGDEAGLVSQAVLSWLIDTTPPKVVARMLLAVAPTAVPYQANALDQLGERGWQWLAAIDAKIAAATSPTTFELYRKHAENHAKEVAADDNTIADAEHVKQLDRWSSVSTKHATQSVADHRREAAALRARRADLIAKSSAVEIQEQTAAAGLSAAEQLDWILDKPGLTAAELRQVATLMSLGDVTFNDVLVAKLQKKFPGATVEDLFAGDVPNDLVLLGGLKPNIAKWLLRGAPPETILRMVASVPELIDEWCATLVAAGIGFGWVRQLGGTYDDKLLRRFALKCPDAATREYIEQRIFGEGDVPGRTAVAPQASPQAYASSRGYLDHDLDEQARHAAARTRKPDAAVAAKESNEIAADVDELTAAELEALRHDHKRLGQVLASASATTFARILDRIQPELQVAIAYATPGTISAAHLMTWTQTRPGREVTATLSDAMLDARAREIFTGLGPLEVFPPLATASVLAPVLQKNPAIIDWLLDSDPSHVIRAFAAPSVIDLAAHALARLDDVEALEKWPSAEALGQAGRSVLVQLAARAKGELKDALDGKLKARLPVKSKDDEGEEEEIAKPDADALQLQSKGAFVERLEQLLTGEINRSTVLALCQAEPAHWSEVASTPGLPERLRKELGVAPTVAFPGISLAMLITRRDIHHWILDTTPAFKVLSVLEPSLDNVFAATVGESSDAANAFVKALPRGRALNAANKATLHRLAKLVDDVRARELFRITFDTDISNLSRAELEKTWSVLELVPHAHVDQRSIEGFRGVERNPDNATAGVYYPDTQSITLQQGNLNRKDPAGEYDHAVSLTEAQAIEALGSKADVDRFVAEQRMQKNEDGTYSFVRQQNIQLFPQTVLHEVGHAVDYMLGARTELIYGIAGWKRFASGDFDGWAADLGGWDVVAEPDKREIRKVWTSWLRGGGQGAVIDMVDGDHPMHAERYKHVGVVRLAHDQPMNSFVLAGNRYAMARHATQEFFSLSQKGYNASPTDYALTAPEEYFAECYANYYREFDGKPESAAKKGANLAPWIKNWFDANIDRVGHNPRR